MGLRKNSFDFELAEKSSEVNIYNWLSVKEIQLRNIAANHIVVLRSGK